jgi:hypothetical protein
LKQWDDIETIYISPDFIVKTGTIVNISVDLDNKLDEFDRENLATIIDTWTYPKHEKDIRPFKLQSFSFAERSFRAEIKFKRKDKEVDELKLLCQDLLDFFNYYHVHMTKWECTLLPE